jgi:uncharacterized protein YlxP (DUF503 family)
MKEKRAVLDDVATELQQVYTNKTSRTELRLVACPLQKDAR